MFKRFAAVAAAVIVAAAAMTVSVFAAGVCTLSQTSSAPAGETFTVDVVLNDNPGIAVLSCNIRYNYEDVEFVSASNGSILEGFYTTDVGTSVQLTWTGNGSDTDANGVAATITFRCKRENPAGSTLSNSVSAFTKNRLPVTIDGNTTILYFGANNPNVVTPADTPENPEETSQAETDQIEEDTEIVADETEPPETTPEPTTTETEPTTERTEPTTRRTRSTQPTTTPEPETEPPTTTPEPTTPPPTTPPPTTTTPPTTTDLPTTVTEPTTETEPAFSDIYVEEVDNKAANRGTLLIAMIAIALTAVCVVGIEYYRKNR